MTTRQEAGRPLSMALASAYGMAAGSRIKLGHPGEVVVGSEELLAGLLGEDAAAEDALAGLFVTSRTVGAVLRHKTDWAVVEQEENQEPPRMSPADFGFPSHRRRGLLRRRRPRPPILVTPAVQRAFQQARPAPATPAVEPRDVLLSLLTSEHTRAAEVLAALGTDPARARAQLTQETPPPPPPRPAEPALAFTQATMLGRATYQPRSRGQRTALWIMDTLRVSWAEVPRIWAALEAQAHADRRGHPAVGSDDFLLGILATHEVASAGPAVLLPPAADHLYAGGRALAAAGVSYRIAQEVTERMAAAERRAGLDDADAEALRTLGIDVDEIIRQAEHTLGPGALTQKRATPKGRDHFGVRVDPEIPPRRLRGSALRTPPSDTGSLLRAVIQDNTRAARLLTELGVEPGQLRTRLDREATP
jgi:hypothetical protein